MAEPNDADRALLAELRELPQPFEMIALTLIARHRELAREDALREAITYVREQDGPDAMLIGRKLQTKFRVRL